MAYYEILQSSHSPQLCVEGVVIVAQRVAIGEKRLSAVLRTNESEAQVAVEIHGVAQRVAIGIAKIAVLIAFAFIERDAGGEEKSAPQVPTPNPFRGEVSMICLG